MSAIIEYLIAKEIHDKTGQWPPSTPAFTEAQIKAILEKLRH